MILGIDTSAGQCAVALVDGAQTWSRSEVMARGHAEALFPMIDAVLAEANRTERDLTRIGVCTGPGSFTGIRAGVAAARGLALGLGIPAIGVSRFQALAAMGVASPLRLPGRSGQVYVQDIAADGTEVGAPRTEPGEAEDRLADPAVIARLAASAEAGPRPAPLYIRGADADPPREAPPVMLD